MDVLEAWEELNLAEVWGADGSDDVLDGRLRHAGQYQCREPDELEVGQRASDLGDLGVPVVVRHFEAEDYEVGECRREKVPDERLRERDSRRGVVAVQEREVFHMFVQPLCRPRVDRIQLDTTELVTSKGVQLWGDDGPSGAALDTYGSQRLDIRPKEGGKPAATIPLRVKVTKFDAGLGDAPKNLRLLWTVYLIEIWDCQVEQPMGLEHKSQRPGGQRSPEVHPTQSSVHQTQPLVVKRDMAECHYFRERRKARTQHEALHVVFDVFRELYKSCWLCGPVRFGRTLS